MTMTICHRLQSLIIYNAPISISNTSLFGAVLTVQGKMTILLDGVTNSIVSGPLIADKNSSQKYGLANLKTNIPFSEHERYKHNKTRGRARFNESKQNK